jgi:hypothetical protein
MVKRTNRIQKLAMEAILALIATGILPVTGARGENKSEGWKTYRDKELKFELKYPAKLIQLSKNKGQLKLLHSIPFEHPRPCEFDDTPDLPLAELIDFNVGIEVVNKDLRGAVVLYEGSAAEYFLTRFTSNSVLKIEPGYIDTAGAGRLKGYRISQGIEGCGRFTYYFSLDSVATLVVTREFITEFKSNTYAENYLKLPGVIIPEKEEQLFNQILTTFKFLK